jgi:predicted phage tail protein
VQAETVAEAIEALSRQLPGLQPDPETGPRVLRVVGCETEADLYKPLGDQTEIFLCPPVALGKDNGFTQVIVGLTLIAVAVAMGGTFWPRIIATIGATLLAGGVSAMLAPQPALRGNEEEERSRYLGAPQNTVGPNIRIPILYGKDLVQGHYLSFDVDAKEAT